MSETQPTLDDLTRTWDHDAPDFAYEASVTAIVRAYNVVIRAHQSVYADLDLTLARFAVLATLERSETGTLGLSPLGKLAFLHPATLTYTVDHLERRGLIVRVPDEVDRRAVSARITPEGRALVQEAMGRLASVQFGVAGLTATEANQLLGLLAKIQGNGQPVASAGRNRTAS